MVTLLSTLDEGGVSTTRRRSKHGVDGFVERVKPLLVQLYKYMGGVDKCDQLLTYYRFKHRTVKWWRIAFIRLIDIAIVNAYILYAMSNQQQRKLNHQQFRVQLAKELLLAVVVQATSDREIFS